VLIGEINPYQSLACKELDILIDEELFGGVGGSSCPSYSTDDSLVQKIRRKLQNAYGTQVTLGRTRIESKPYFSRYGTDPSTSTEVLAETKSLSICRMALLLIQRNKD
jgi:hypothetical protein